ncbi:glycosyltransferase family 2 protein [Undibacterium sp. Ji67W]|uniref:glycosyltransferase family 2 protein n=1 Tax=Undibacterium sp. Ji67W TaxID=3413042 RepID=UPI003BF0672D
MLQEKIGIVTVTFNSGIVLEDFFQSVSDLDYDNYVLYVVDNESKDQTLEMVRKYSEINHRVVLIPNSKNLGVAKGNNQGIEQALKDNCEYVVLLNNDTTFEKNLFIDMINKMKNKKVLMSVPKMMFFDEPEKIWCAGGGLKFWQAYAVSHHGLNQNDSKDWDVDTKIDYSPTCCMFIHRAVFEKIGIMDEDYFVYCDDTDFCIRAHKANIQLWYLPVAKLWHKVSSLTGKNSPFSTRMSTRNRVYMIRKFANWAARPYHYAIMQLDFIARIIVRGERWSEYSLRQRSFVEGFRMQIK